MSVIYLKHPQFGTKVAVLEAEAKNDEAKGWQRFDPTVQAPEILPVEVIAKRRGRPPKIVQ